MNAPGFGLRLVFVLVLSAFCENAPAQQPPIRNAADCASLGGIDDLACQEMLRQNSGPQYGSELALPGIPVIRDQASPALNERSERPSWQSAQRPPSPLPPEPPTEFQNFVEQSTGRLLPVFGSELFLNAPTTFAPADRVPVTPDYIVGPGDQLLIRGWGQIDLNVSPTVDRSGAIYIPRVGSASVAGLRFAQVQDFLKTTIGRVYRNFDLTVNMGQLRSIQVFVLGQARRPGSYTVSALSTLVNAVFVSGGPSSRGSMRSIRLIRGDQTVSELDLYDLFLYGDKSKDQRLLPGDVIYIPPVGPQVAITGSVNTAAIYELKGNSSLEEGLRIAGGLTPVAATRKAYIERIEDSTRRVLELSLNNGGAEAAKLRSGDVVSILAVLPGFENAVTLRGNVADPIRMPWHPGMKILDLIPDREALLTRDYWQTRNRLAPATPTDAGSERSVAGSADRLSTPISYSPSSLASAVMPDRRRGATEGAGGDAGSESSPSEARGGPGSIGATKEGTQAPTRNRIERNALEPNWNYAVIERRNPDNLTTTLIPFGLGKVVIDHNQTENLPLQPGDVVTIFSTADLKLPQRMQTRYVRLEGEFESAGVYSVRPGETLRQLVQRAGGLTPQAYLFGSEFTRESARLEQQQRLNDLADTLERQVASAAANVRGSVISPEEATSAASQIAGQRELVQKLRQVKATGRIVLDVNPKSPVAGALPDLPLEDGDVFTVPSRPSFVNVVGSVYNSTSFLYTETKRLGDYLREAGGATRTGDGRHAFLIRADGSVVSRTWSVNPLAHSFEDIRLNAGDTIVVPEQINKTTFLKGLKDWSQIFAQFGLGAAAINVLR
jgi:polysaccharide biosynthesis/export protein